jgi:hypothetical protein
MYFFKFFIRSNFSLKGYSASLIRISQFEGKKVDSVGNQLKTCFFLLLIIWMMCCNALNCWVLCSELPHESYNL